jgi:hypothetical protein
VDPQPAKQGLVDDCWARPGFALRSNAAKYGRGLVLRGQQKAADPSDSPPAGQLQRASKQGLDREKDVGVYPGLDGRQNSGRLDEVAVEVTPGHIPDREQGLKVSRRCAV